MKHYIKPEIYLTKKGEEIYVYGVAKNEGVALFDVRIGSTARKVVNYGQLMKALGKGFKQIQFSEVEEE